MRGAVMGKIADGLGWVFCLAFGLAMAAGAAGAAQVITSDMGGALEQRYALLEDLRRRGERIEIAGECYSACTLYLGLEGVCVMPQARLGFHGPSTAFPGLPLPAADFERQTQRMASYYPPAIRNWFLAEARHVTRSLYVLDGAQLIAMGTPAC